MCECFSIVIYYTKTLVENVKFLKNKTVLSEQHHASLLEHSIVRDTHGHRLLCGKGAVVGAGTQSDLRHRRECIALVHHIGIQALLGVRHGVRSLFAGHQNFITPSCKKI